MKRVGQLFRENLVNEVKDGIVKNNNVFLLSYKQLSGAKASDLRKVLQKAGASVYVSKNSIARVALKDLEREQLAEQIGDQVAFVFSNADSVEVSKILVQFQKENENLKVQGGILEDRILSDADVKRLSDLPSREVLLSMLLGTIQAPLSRLASALNAKTRDVLSILKQLSEQKGGK